MAALADARLQKPQSSLDPIAAAGSNNTSSSASTADTGLGRNQPEPAAAAAEAPVSPPPPVIGHLRSDEIDALSDVLSRMEMFEAEESARIRYRPHRTLGRPHLCRPIYRRLADGDVHCAGSATYQNYF